MSFPEGYTPSDYHYKKTDDLLSFGVQRVVWIITETRKIMIAEAGKNWIVAPWSQTIELLLGHEPNLEVFLNELD